MKIYICPVFSLFSAALLLLASCVSHPDVPTLCEEADCLPSIYPDYCNVTVPCNIAPLNFMLTYDDCTACVARITTPDGAQQTYGKGAKVQIPEDEWHAMRDAAVGKSLQVEVWGEEKGQWVAYKPFEIKVAAEPIDEYISYRLVEPTYVAWSYMSIAQRNLTNFDESEIYNNAATENEREKGQCINCHSYQNYKTDNMLFHVRLSNGCTVIVNDGKITKTNLKRDYTISAGVYPSWHPTEKLVAFSTNRTRQGFHTLNHNKIEVYDEASDLILYDIERDSVHVVCADPDLLEVYPTWSPDGKYLYYCKTIPLPDSVRAQGVDIRNIYPYIQYNLYRKSFDVSKLAFGEEEMVYDAASQDKCATLPRISPDGRYLLFAEGHYGCFHSRHEEADIVCMALTDDSSLAVADSTIDISLLNSDGYSESYPSWSSNGHWIMTASRRDDGNYSRCYFSYFHDGKADKAFLLPQEDPEHNTFRLKSYNRPEFMVEPVTISVKEFAEVVGR